MPWLIKRRKRDTLEYETYKTYESKEEAERLMAAIPDIQARLRKVTGKPNAYEFHVEEDNEQG